MIFKMPCSRARNEKPVLSHFFYEFVYHGTLSPQDKHINTSSREATSSGEIYTCASVSV